MLINTVEPPDNGHILCREVVLFQRPLITVALGSAILSFGDCLLFEGISMSFVGEVVPLLEDPVLEVPLLL